MNAARSRNFWTGDSENESDGSTSFTDEEEEAEGTHLDEAEDEEERLIMNGGAGIPVGPVCDSKHWFHSNSDCVLNIGWRPTAAFTAIVAKICGT